MPPIKKPRQAKVRVLTVKMPDTAKTVDEQAIDLNRQRDKTWLIKHLDWALRNGHGVQLSPE